MITMLCGVITMLSRASRDGVIREAVKVVIPSLGGGLSWVWCRSNMQDGENRHDVQVHWRVYRTPGVHEGGCS